MPNTRVSSAFSSAVVVVWLLLVSCGMGALQWYSNRPGSVGSAPRSWPQDSNLKPATDRSTLVLFAHPHCPCTRASLAELAAIMTRCHHRLTAHVVFLQPEHFPSEWSQTDLWEGAARMPDVKVHADGDGREAERFGAETSGQAVLFDPQGTLLFQGGITSARGHQGDNLGRAAIVRLVMAFDPPAQESTEPSRFPVFGCPLFD